MELLIAYLKISPLELEGVIWASVGIQWEGHSKHTCAYDGGRGGSNYGHFGANLLIE